MKKVLAIFAVVAIFGATSCKKDYTCVCSWSGQTDVEYEYKDVKKADAEDSCDALNTAASASGGSCELK